MEPYYVASGAWFGVVGLASVGEREATSPHVAKALAFLRSKQLPDGGWGESYLSSSRKEYHHADASQAPPPHPLARAHSFPHRTTWHADASPATPSSACLPFLPLIPQPV